MTRNTPIVSIVMSVFNGEKYIRDAVESILNQTFNDFEFIIINDGSADSTAQILGEYAQADNRIRIFEQANKGLTRSLNRGISLARGKWIARQDADDISIPTRLEKQLEYLVDHPEVGALGTDVNIINSGGEIIESRRFDLDNADIRLHLLTRNNVLTHGSVMFSKSIFEQAGGYNENLKYTQDYDLWWRMSRYTKLATLPTLLYCFRKHDNSISSDQRHEQAQMDDWISVRNCLDTIREIISEMKEKIVDIELVDMSAIICTGNSYSDFVRCICHVLKQDILPKEIVIVDTSNDGAVEKVATKTLDIALPVVRYVHSKSGLAHQRNIGIRNSSGSIILFLNDDMLLYPGFVRNILRIFEEDPGFIGGVGGNIINAHRDEKSYRALLQRLFFSYGFGDGSLKRSGTATYPYGLSKVKEVEFLGGGQVAYRREVCEEFSFDEFFTEGYSYIEVDFSFRVSRKYKNYYTPYALSFHNNKTPMKRLKFNGYRAIELRHHSYHFHKNAPKSLLNWIAFGLSVFYIRYLRQMDTMLELLSLLKRRFQSTKCIL